MVSAAARRCQLNFLHIWAETARLLTPADTVPDASSLYGKKCGRLWCQNVHRVFPCCHVDRTTDTHGVKAEGVDSLWFIHSPTKQRALFYSHTIWFNILTLSTPLYFNTCHLSVSRPTPSYYLQSLSHYPVSSIVLCLSQTYLAFTKWRQLARRWHYDEIENANFERSRPSPCLT